MVLALHLWGEMFGGKIVLLNFYKKQASVWKGLDRITSISGFI